MPPPHNYNLRTTSSAGAAGAVQGAANVQEDLDGAMATGFKLEKFRGDGTDDIEEFLKRFERYCNVTNVKNEQKMVLLCLHLEGRASWYIDSLTTAPVDLAAGNLSKPNVPSITWNELAVCSVLHRRYCHFFPDL